VKYLVGHKKLLKMALFKMMKKTYNTFEFLLLVFSNHISILHNFSTLPLSHSDFQWSWAVLQQVYNS